MEKKGGYTTTKVEKAKDISKHRSYMDVLRTITEAEPYLKKQVRQYLRRLWETQVRQGRYFFQKAHDSSLETTWLRGQARGGCDQTTTM